MSLIVVRCLNIHSYLDVDIQFQEIAYTFNENDGIVQVCTQLMAVIQPTREYPIVVSFQHNVITSNAGMYRLDCGMPL